MPMFPGLEDVDDCPNTAAGCLDLADLGDVLQVPRNQDFKLGKKRERHNRSRHSRLLACGVLKDLG